MISVVIPLYNKEKSIALTIDCLKHQTMQDFEIVIIDDGSTDASYANAVTAINGDERFLVVRQSNKGVSAARNNGVQLAKYDYVAFLDADDIWSSQYLEVLSKLIVDYPNAGIYGMGWKHIHRPEDVIDEENIMECDFFRGNIVSYWNSPFVYTSSSVALRKSLIMSLKGFDERMSYGEDIDMWFRAILCSQAVYDSRVLAFYVQEAENRLMNTSLHTHKRCGDLKKI